MSVQRTIGGITVDIDTEEPLGSEDRLFADCSDEPLWYWQSRGTSDCVGPFACRDEAIADYDDEESRNCEEIAPGVYEAPDGTTIVT